MRFKHSAFFFKNIMTNFKLLHFFTSNYYLNKNRVPTKQKMGHIVTERAGQLLPCGLVEGISEAKAENRNRKSLRKTSGNHRHYIP